MPTSDDFSTFWNVGGHVFRVDFKVVGDLRTNFLSKKIRLLFDPPPLHFSEDPCVIFLVYYS